MASNINSTNIDGTYPIAGQTNDTQGFRDNFTNIVNNFTTAAAEITDLQSKVIVKSPLAGLSINNDMAGAGISNALLTAASYTVRYLGTTSGTVTLDYSTGNIQEIITSGAVTLGFSNWPANGVYGSMLLWIQITNTAHTITVSTTSPGVTLGLSNVSSVNGYANGVIAFANAGTYLLSFSTVDNGQNILINDLTRNFNNIQDDVSITGNLTLSSMLQLTGITTTQRASLSPANGALIYNSTYNKFQGYASGTWGNITLS